MTDHLSARQELFCRHYVLGTSAAAAARAAGYSEATARSQAWRLLQQPSIQGRIAALQGNRNSAAAALCAQLWAQVEEVRQAALKDKAYGTALRVVVTQMRLFKTLGLPAAPADTEDIIQEGLAAEAEAAQTEAGGAVPAAEPGEGASDALLDRLDEIIDQAGAASLANTVPGSARAASAEAIEAERAEREPASTQPGEQDPAFKTVAEARTDEGAQTDESAQTDEGAETAEAAEELAAVETDSTVLPFVDNGRRRPRVSAPPRETRTRDWRAEDLRSPCGAASAAASSPAPAPDDCFGPAGRPAQMPVRGP